MSATQEQIDKTLEPVGLWELERYFLRLGSNVTTV
jgi:hypothetical protein